MATLKKRAAARVGGLVKKISRGAPAGPPTVQHQDDRVGDVDRLGLVMGDEDRGDRVVVVQLAHQPTHLHPELDVKLGERLVEQQHLRLQDQRPGQGHPLLLAAGQLAHPTPGECGQLDPLQHLGHPVADQGTGDPSHPQTEADVVCNAEVREEQRSLEDDPDGAALGGYVPDAPAVEADVPPVRLEQAGDHR